MLSFCVNLPQRTGLFLCCCAAFLLAGCADFTAGFAPLDRTVDLTTVQAHSRAGKVYCARGWLGIFSTGMMQLADRINTKEGITAISTADMEYWRLQDWLVEQHKKGTINEPLVLLGHSWGADDMVRVSERLKQEGISVDLLVLIDPVAPPAAPANVKRVYCVYKSHPETDAVPLWRGVAASVKDATATQLVNIDLRTADVPFDTKAISHPEVDKVEGVHDMCIEEIKKVCPPRTVWLQTHPTGATATTQPTAGPLSLAPGKSEPRP